MATKNEVAENKQEVATQNGAQVASQSRNKVTDFSLGIF